jgi:two-component system, sensor histidine kinase PdtaS
VSDLPWSPGTGLRGDMAAASAIEVEEDEDFTAEHVALVVPPVDAEASRHLKRLVANWSVLADLAFADLLLYVALPPSGGSDAQPADDRFLVVNQVRPNTSFTLFSDDVVGRSMGAAQRPLVAQSMRAGEITEGVVDSPWLGDNIRVTSIPVRFRGRTIAVVACESALSLNRDPSNLAAVYRDVFHRLARMVADGIYPFAEEEVVGTGGPRVGDGVVLLDSFGRIAFASPNAVSALRRVGVREHVTGKTLTGLGAEVSASYRAFFNGQPTVEEVERDEAAVVIRCIPLISSNRVDGALVLLRDITEVRSRDRLLVSKDATIKEIHHRVKNNLQTISSLLRLQGRRLKEPEAKTAIEESVRRIRSIALVHETLSRGDGDDVDFLEVLRPLVRMVEEGLTSPDRPMDFRITGESGKLPSHVATSLAVVLTELLQNVVDHAYPPELFPPGSVDPGHRSTVDVVLTHDAQALRVRVVDDGVGPPEGWSPDHASSLGLTIVRSLVSELDGSIDFSRARPGSERSGMEVSLAVPVVYRVDNAQRPPREGGRSVGL